MSAKHVRQSAIFVQRKMYKYKTINEAPPWTWTCWSRPWGRTSWWTCSWSGVTLPSSSRFAIWIILNLNVHVAHCEIILTLNLNLLASWNLKSVLSWRKILVDSGWPPLLSSVLVGLAVGIRLGAGVSTPWRSWTASRWGRPRPRTASSSRWWSAWWRCWESESGHSHWTIPRNNTKVARRDSTVTEPRWAKAMEV